MKLPTVNSLSGGKTSSYMAVNYKVDHDIFSLVCLDDPSCRLPDKKLIQKVNDKLAHYGNRFKDFQGTAEHNGTIKLIFDLEQYIGRPITFVRGRSYEEIINDPKNGTLPSDIRRYCTDHMKVKPIFEYCYTRIAPKVSMNIGFRWDEYNRMSKFMNRLNSLVIKAPLSSKNYGTNQLKWESINWRECHFPLIKDPVSKHYIELFWNSYSNLIFPPINNCVMCFHRKVSTLAALVSVEPEKMLWAAKQEIKGKGTFRRSDPNYAEICANHKELGREITFELLNGIDTCDSGGCTG